jgi:hypothetical protein
MNAPFQHARLGPAALAFVAGKHQLFIGGRFVDARRAARMVPKS